MTRPLELQDRASRVAYMAAALVDHFGTDAGRIIDNQIINSADDIAATWEDIQTHITDLLPWIARDV